MKYRSTFELSPGLPTLFWIFSYAICLMILLPVLADSAGMEWQTRLFQTLVWLSYGALYLLPGFALTRLIEKVALTSFVYPVAVTSTSLTMIFLYADLSTYKIFGFHINSFVWNIVTTRGGIESLGANNLTIATYAFYVVAIVAVQVSALAVALRARSIPLVARLSRLITVAAIPILCLAAVTERGYYGVSHAAGNTQVLSAAGVVPLYLPLTFRTLAAKFGYEVKRLPKLHTQQQEFTNLVYPRKPISKPDGAKNFNIVWLVAESLRGDMMSSAYMPALADAAREGAVFSNHLSGGNGTRMGMFSMFYGLHGTYWHSMLNARRPPVLIETLQGLGYEMLAQTSAHFSYPEFDKTIFSSLDQSQLHENAVSPDRWIRDQQNVDRGLDWIAQQQQPFFYFQFFEAPHAGYYFPEKTAVHHPYLEHFNYASMNLATDIGQIKNRYLNSVLYLDSQFARILTMLRESGHMERTVVVITGDHGEAFMEHGRWGHNSDFTNEQIHVPLVILAPDVVPRYEERMTRHVDLPATVFSLLGIDDTSAGSYSLGNNLFSDESADYAVVSDWHGAVVITDRYKLLMNQSFKSLGQASITTRNDEAVADQTAAFEMELPALQQVLSEMIYFTDRGAG
ncbi:MAG: sulfatase-like hydrolase/transferase [Pseudomonadales bacterium]